MIIVMHNKVKTLPIANTAMPSTPINIFHKDTSKIK